MEPIQPVSERDGKTRRPKQKKTDAVLAGSEKKSPKTRAARKSSPVALLSEDSSRGVHPVTFDYFNPAARSVFLAGSFNDWSAAAAPMTRDGEGHWSAELILTPGSYEYRLIVDGLWQEDPMAAGFKANPFGGLNSVVVVKG